jgi:hypothetical protein
MAATPRHFTSVTLIGMEIGRTMFHAGDPSLGKKAPQSQPSG